MRFSKFTDAELVLTAKKLNKIIKVVKGDVVLDEKVLVKLPEPVIKHIYRNKKAHTNPFHIASLYGDITSEMANRFMKEYSEKEKWSE